MSSNVGTKSKTTNGDTGLLTDNSKTSWATQIGYTQPQYAVSAIVNLKYNGWTDGYLHTAAADDAVTGGDGNHTAYGLRGWWRPTETGTATPSISLGYDSTVWDGADAVDDTSNMWFAGFTWQDIFQADDRVGLALGQPTTNEDESTVDPFAYEFYYSFKSK